MYTSLNTRPLHCALQIYEKANEDCRARKRPGVVTAIGEAYLGAGSDIVSTNTFSANRISQADYGAEHLVADINHESARLGREAAVRYQARDGRRRFIEIGRAHV